MAAAYGDYPETAASRMRWARYVIETVHPPDRRFGVLTAASAAFLRNVGGSIVMGKASDAATGERECGVDDKRNGPTLIGRAASGDECAWELIVVRYTPYLSTIGRAYCLSPEEISDALQQTWMSVVTHLSSLRDHARFRPWLAAIMRRSCTAMIQHPRYGHEQLAGDLTDMIGEGLRDERVDVEHEVLAAERTSIVRQALRLLPERERELLHYLAADDLSYDEITRRLSMPLGSIGPTRMRALRRLRVILEETQAVDMLLAA